MIESMALWCAIGAVALLLATMLATAIALSPTRRRRAEEDALRTTIFYYARGNQDREPAMRQLAKPTCDPRDDRLDLLREVVFLYATRLADGGLAARQALAGTYESRSPLRPRKNTQESPEKARNLGP